MSVPREGELECRTSHFCDRAAQEIRMWSEGNQDHIVQFEIPPTGTGDATPIRTIDSF